MKVEDRGGEQPWVRVRQQQVQGTYYDGCWLDHHDCAVARVEALELELFETERLTAKLVHPVHGELREARALLRELADAICRVGDWGENTRVGDVLERVEKLLEVGGDAKN